MPEKKSTPNNVLLNGHNQVTTPKTNVILAHHFEEWVTGSAVNEEITRLNVQSMDALTAVEYLGFGANTVSGGWWVSGVNPLLDRPKNPPYGQFKPDTPLKTKGKKPAKYLTAKGQAVDAIWLAMPGDDYWDGIISDSDKIIITEGAKKAGAGLSVGLPTVSVTGVWNWVKKKTGELAPGLKSFVSMTKDKTYYIAMDSDYISKPECVKAILSLGKVLKGEGVKDIRIITWSQDYKGMDDYIKANGGDEFKNRLDVATKIKEWEKQFKDDDEGIDIPSKHHPRETPKTVADELVESHRNDWAYHNEQKVWRTWNGKYWEEYESDAFSQLVLNELEVKKVELRTPSFLKNVIEFLRIKLLVKKWITFDRKQYVPFNNGVLDLQANKLLPHDTGYRFTHCIDRNYSPIESSGDILADLKRYHPHGYDYIMEASNHRTDAALKMLAVIAGIVKWRFSALQKFIYIQGKPRSGKGTFIRLITEIIGSKNVESSCLNKLSGEYEIAEIIGSQLVVFPDEDKQDGGYSIFKKLTGGDELRYRQIYGKPGKGKLEGSILISSNGSIFAGDATGIKERQCTLVFDNQVAEEVRSPLFEERLHQDIDKLLSVVLMMPDDEIDARIKGLLDHSAVMYREREWSLKCDVSGVAAFIEDKLKPSKEGFIISSELFEQYSYYCDDNKYGKTQKNKMTNELINTIDSYLHWEGIESKTKRVNDKPVKVITGLSWRGEDDIFVSEKLAQDAVMAQNSQPLPQIAVTEGGVTAEALLLKTTANQGIELTVTAVTAESQTFLDSDFSVDWGEDEPTQLDLMAIPEKNQDRTAEIVDRLKILPTVDKFGEIVRTYKPSELQKAHNLLIKEVAKQPNELLIKQLELIKQFKGEWDKKSHQEKEESKKRQYLKKLGNNPSGSQYANVKLEINNPNYCGKARMLGHGKEVETYKVLPLSGYQQQLTVKFHEITIPDDAWIVD